MIGLVNHCPNRWKYVLTLFRIFLIFPINSVKNRLEKMFYKQCLVLLAESSIHDAEVVTQGILMNRFSEKNTENGQENMFGKVLIY